MDRRIEMMQELESLKEQILHTRKQWLRDSLQFNYEKLKIKFEGYSEGFDDAVEHKGEDDGKK